MPSCFSLSLKEFSMPGVPKRALNQQLLFQLVRTGRTGSRAGGFVPADRRERQAAEKMLAEFFVQITPGAHVEWLFLDPQHGCAVIVGRESFFQQIIAQGIELFEPNDGDVVALELLAKSQQFVINFSSAKQDARDILRRQIVRDNLFKMPARKFLEW